MDNYNFDISKNIYCIKILDTYAEFRIGDKEIFNYITLSLINDNLVINCKWNSSDRLPYLSDTLIMRKFKIQ